MPFASFACNVYCDIKHDDSSCVYLLTHKRLLKREIKVGLPDGTFRVVHKVGTAMLNDSLSIHDVLLVEGFKHNLLSVSKLAEKENILVHFTKDACYF